MKKGSWTFLYQPDNFGEGIGFVGRKGLEIREGGTRVAVDPVILRNFSKEGEGPTSTNV